MLTNLMSSIFCFPESPEKLALRFKKMYQEELDRLNKKTSVINNDEFSRQLLAELTDASNDIAWKLVPTKFPSLARLFNSTIEEDLEELEAIKNNDENISRLFYESKPHDGFSAYYALTYRLAEIYISALKTDNTNNALSCSNDWQRSFDFFEDRVYTAIFNYLEDYASFADSQITNLVANITPNTFYISRMPNKTAYPKDVAFYCQELRLIVLLVLLRNNQGTDEERKKAYSYVSKRAVLAWGRRFYSDSYYHFGFSFSSEAMDIDDPKLRQNAFNLMGVCAIENGQLQLAYDAYLSWISKKLAFENSLQIADERKEQAINLLTTKKESQYREQNPEDVAVMYGNFAYVCGTMYDNLDPDSTTYFFLVEIAKYFIKRAIELAPENASYYCSAGTIFSDDKSQSMAMKYYLKYQDTAHTLTDRLTAARCITDSLLDKLFFDNTLNDDDRLKLNVNIELFIRLYNILKDKESLNDSEKEEFVNGRKMYSFLNVVSKLSDESSETKILLFLVERVTGKILNILRRSTYSVCFYELHSDDLPDQLREELKNCAKKGVDINRQSPPQAPIAYYTKLSRLKHLFDAVDQAPEGSLGKVNIDNGQNRFTVMHERYMNDPEEGIVLLNRVSQYLPKSPTEMRDELLDQKYVFLKSFTGLIDTLNMWTLYGSDKENGQDCNGCCVCISPDTFDLIVKNSSGASTQLYTKASDDYHLYKVAYMKGEDIYLDGEINMALTDYYMKLKNLLIEVKQNMSSGTQEEKEIITDALMRTLEKIIFLFKEYAYNMEKESRLILTREIGDDSDIKSTSGVPQLLFISPPFQVFIEKIILGPKLNNPDLWIPILQKELCAMSNKWTGDPQKKPKPVVRKSSINIRD